MEMITMGVLARALRRAAVAYYEANIAAWESLKWVTGGPDGAVFVGLVLMVVTIGLACAGLVVASWVTAGASVALVVAREARA